MSISAFLAISLQRLEHLRVSRERTFHAAFSHASFFFYFSRVIGDDEPTIKGVFKFGGDSPAVGGNKSASAGADSVDMHDAVVKKIKEVGVCFSFLSCLCFFYYVEVK